MQSVCPYCGPIDWNNKYSYSYSYSNNDRIVLHYYPIAPIQSNLNTIPIVTLMYREYNSSTKFKQNCTL